MLLQHQQQLKSQEIQALVSTQDFQILLGLKLRIGNTKLTKHGADSRWHNNPNLISPLFKLAQMMQGQIAFNYNAPKVKLQRDCLLQRFLNASMVKAKLKKISSRLSERPPRNW
tara:strand:- start:442 stop:783 length:342 start_codon:yes stop_codon:yes gene_type:complete